MNMSLSDVHFEENKEKIAPKYRGAIEIAGKTCTVYSRNIEVFELLDAVLKMNKQN